jgi:hypothetical protein
MAKQFSEGVEILNTQGKVTIKLDGNQIKMGDVGDNKERIRLNGNGGNIWLGGNGADGDIVVFRNDGDNKTLSQAAIHLDGNEGDIIIRHKINGTMREVMRFDASHAALYIGCEGNEGDIIVRDGAGREVFRFDSNYAALYIGAAGNEGDIIVRDGAGNERIRLDGHTGDIKLQGADCAEEFDVAEIEKIDPGTVLVIDDESKLRACKEPYDKKVAGVISGGNGSNPGIILGKNPTQNQRLPIALSGKVYCKVDAQYSPIEIGDLLTTSPTPGHAMKAEDPSKAFGAVIGKALASLKEGTGMIPILVALQ